MPSGIGGAAQELEPIPEAEEIAAGL